MCLQTESANPSYPCGPDPIVFLGDLAPFVHQGKEADLAALPYRLLLSRSLVDGGGRPSVAMGFASCSDRPVRSLSFRPSVAGSFISKRNVRRRIPGSWLERRS